MIAADSSAAAGVPEDAQMRLRQIDLWVCVECLAREGFECHTPGCAFWMHDVPTVDTAAALRAALDLSAAAVPEDGGEALRREGCMRADKACRWRPATTSDANPDDLVCDGCGARQRPEFPAPVRQTNGEEKR